MSTIVELNQKSRSAQKDWKGQMVAQLVWDVDIRDPKEALEFAKTEAGVDVNMPFPGYPNLIADVVAARVNDREVGNEIVATFSTDRRFGGSQNIDKDKDGYYSTDIDIRSVAFKTPVNFRTSITITVNGASEVTDVWDIENHDIDEPRAFFEVNTVTNLWSLNRTKAVLAQINKIHIIGGTPLLFRGARTYQRRASGGTLPPSWDLTYLWEMDPGTERLDSPDDTKFIIGINTALRRDPFNKYIVRPSADPKLDEHEVWQYAAYATDAGGYLTLPSIPPI